MINENRWIRTTSGPPKASDFASRFGTPIVIDILTGFAYYLHKNVVYPLQVTAPSVVGAFSNGFSDGFS
jgi:hypothetical protein